ncbi:hypothetical protein GCM10027031_01680 [Corynebacterium atrinae]
MGKAGEDREGEDGDDIRKDDTRGGHEVLRFHAESCWIYSYFIPRSDDPGAARYYAFGESGGVETREQLPWAVLQVEARLFGVEEVQAPEVYCGAFDLE